MKKYILLIPILLSLVLIGCATPQNRPQYMWKDYSTSLYAVKKAPSNTTMASHKAVLLSIIEESKTKNLKVPPGVYCECGYMFLKEGKKEEAFKYFDLEEQTYPESRVFVQNLKTFASRSPAKDDARKKDNNEGGSSSESKEKPVNTEGK
jgi:hypothetical protein